MKKRFLSFALVVVMLVGAFSLTSSAATECSVADNVIDIADKDIWSLSRYYARVTDIRISGADVESATQDDTTVDIVLSGATAPDAEISIEFGTALNKSKMTGHIASTVLSGGEAQLVMTLKGEYASMASMNASVTYTLNFSTAILSTEAPECIKETDSISTYSGVAVDIKLKDYFKGANEYYLLSDGEEISIEGTEYTFTAYEGGIYNLIFSASNDNGYCTEQAVITIEVAEIDSGTWLGITTSNGGINFVRFTDDEGNGIEGLTAYLEDKTIMVNVPRNYPADGNITATFDIAQNGSGLPFITTKTGTAGTASDKAVNNKFTEKTTKLNSGGGTYKFYLYNANPSTTNNSYTTYTVNYVTANNAPVLAEGMEENASESITADCVYTLDLNGIFTDPDEDDTITGWMVSVDGSEAKTAVTYENNVYSYSTNDAGVHTLVFYALDNYSAMSQDAYTVTLTVDNALTTYDVMVTVRGVESAPVFYYSKDAKEGTELTADSQGSVYTVKVPTNVSEISYRADGIGMNVPVSAEKNNIILIKPVFNVIADEATDENTVVEVSHATLNVVGDNGNYLLLAGEKYTITATPSDDYSEKWKEGKLEAYVLSGNVVEIELVSKGTLFIFPYFASLTVSEASGVQGIPPVIVYPVKTTEADYASGTKTATYQLKDGKVYEYRVSVPEDNVNRNEYVTYVATFTKSGSESITITKEQIEAGDKGRTTIDRDVNSNRGRNVADLYTNVNYKGYKKLNKGEEFQLVAVRNYRGVNADWLMNANYYYVEPEFHYTVVNEDGIEDNSVITIDKNGKITAVGEGTAIVMITYDAMTLNHEFALSEGALGDYPSTPNDFYGAIWPENTGVFVVSVGYEDSGINTGMTINHDKATSQKASGKYIDAELDIIYFIGDTGEYTFTPQTEGVSVWVANPSVTDSMTFTGFEEILPNDDSSVTIPLKTGRNIVKLVLDGKAEYQVITAKGVNVTVNGSPLESATVSPGQKVKIEFDNLFAPAGRMAIYNTSAAVVYSEVSGYDGKMAGNIRSSMGEYTFSSNPAKRTVENLISASADGSGYSNSQVTSEGELIVPEDFNGEYFTLSGGSFNIGGFMPYLLGSHYEKLGIIPPNNVSSDNINCYLGVMPDISIPVSEDGDADGGNEESGDGEDTGSDNEDDEAGSGNNTGNSGGGSGSEKYNSIKVYITFVKGDTIVVQSERITVYDKDGDGKYTIGDAFRTLHRERYSGGESGYKEVSGNGVVGWVSKFWGTSDTTFVYALNHSWAKSTEDTIENGDKISALIGKDSQFYSDLFTWFEKESYSAKVNTDIEFEVNGLNLMASSSSYDALHAPHGATVSVYDKTGKEIKNMATVVAKDGSFTLCFENAGTYTVKVSGNAKWGSYSDAPVAPSTCKVTVSAGSGGTTVKNEKNKNEETKTPEETLETKNEFTDAKGHWGEEYINFVTERGLYNGVGEGIFGVNDAMTRAMLVTVLHRLGGTPQAKAESSFADVKEDTWYSDAVLWASAEGIVNGVDEYSFSPDGKVTREQVATILYRYVKYLDMTLEYGESLEEFSDFEDVSPWATEAMAWAVGEGIITGKPNNILDPKGNATRTEVAAVLMRFITNMEE